MLVMNQTSFLCSSIKYYHFRKNGLLFQNSCSTDYFSPRSTNLVPPASLFPNESNSSSSCLRRNRAKMSVLYSDFPAVLHDDHAPPEVLESPPVLLDQAEESCDGNNNNGIGIEEFFKGKNIFITGATGLVGKVLVEKLLRSTEVGKIYMLIKAKDEEVAFHRLTNEIVNSELFKCLEEKHGKYSNYQEFMQEKLIAVAGNICEPNLGMDSNSARAIMKEVDVIIQSAANTTLCERYDFILDTNVTAPQRVLRFAKMCNNLKLFVHISTAYVNGKREGIIFEKPLTMGENRFLDDDDETQNISSSSSFPRVEVANEINLALESLAASAGCDVTKELKRLGQQRADMHGWHNAYQMSKAMGEMVLNEKRGDVPLLIIRPTVIESTYAQPFPGWIQGNRMFDPVIISYGKGQLPAFICDPQGHMDIIPVDIVANTTIAAMAKHGKNLHDDKPEVNVYHVASGIVNPLRFSDFFGYIHEHFNSLPLMTSNSSTNYGSQDHEYTSIPCMKCFNDFDTFSKYIREENGNYKKNINVALLNDEIMIRKLQKQCKAKVAYAEQLCKMYEFIGFFNGRFDTGNTQKLLQEMSRDEKDQFEVDARNIEWRKYFVDIHIPGLRKHVINGTKVPVV